MSEPIEDDATDYGRCGVAEAWILRETGLDVTVPITDPRGCAQCMRVTHEPTPDNLTPAIVTFAAAALREDHPGERAQLLAATRGLRGAPEFGVSEPFTPATTTPRYLTEADLVRDTLALIPKLPHNVTAVAGVSRSGVAPAAILAMHLHVPLLILRHEERDIISASHGWRLDKGKPAASGVTLVVDDTCMTGRSVRLSREITAGAGIEALHSGVYVNPAAEHKPDICAVDLPWPHLLSWNLCNSVLLPSCAFDFDGVLCRDCRPEEDDDGPAYSRFLETAEPLHLPRREPIPLIVTARLAKYRPQTEAWLRRHGIRWKQLTMGPWTSWQHRQGKDVGAWKAEHYRRFARKPCGLKPKLFIESDPRQAERIAEVSGGLVVCPTNARCYP